MGWSPMAEGLGGATPAAFVLKAVIDILGRGDLGAPDKLTAVFEATLAHRMDTIARRVLDGSGDVVLGGPFAGMEFGRVTAEGCVIPKLLGCYEAELAPIILALPEAGYEVIVNVGSAEGYYAIGLAHLVPTVRVHAYDSNPEARRKCIDLARRNGVTDRVSVGERLDPSGWAEFAGRRVFVLCDIEGGEVDLLDPVAAPALRGFDMLVEVHPDAGIEPDEFAARFAASHAIDWIHPAARDAEAYPQLAALDPLDRVLALVERLTPTPWVHLTARRVSP